MPVETRLASDAPTVVETQRDGRRTSSPSGIPDGLLDLFDHGAELAAVTAATLPARGTRAARLTSPDRALPSPCAYSPAAPPEALPPPERELERRGDAVLTDGTSGSSDARRVETATTPSPLRNAACPSSTNTSMTSPAQPVAREDLLGERVLEQALNRTAERAGAERGVEALLRQKLAGVLGERDAEALLAELHAQPVDHEVDDLLDLLGVQVVEDDDLVDAVEELGAEELLELAGHALLDGVVADAAGRGRRHEARAMRSSRCRARRCCSS